MAHIQLQKAQRRRAGKPLSSLDRFAVWIFKGVPSWRLALLAGLVMIAILISQLTDWFARFAFGRAYVLRSSSLLFAVATVALIGVMAYECCATAIIRFIHLRKSARLRKVGPLPVSPVTVRDQLQPKVRRAFFIALVCGALAAVSNIVVTLYGSFRYDEELLKARASFYDSTGCFALNSADRSDGSLLYCGKSDGGFEVRLPLGNGVPSQMQTAFETFEDRGLARRLSSFNVRGIGRALFDALTNVTLGSENSTLQGASGLPEQLGALLIGLKPRGERTWFGAVATKFQKFIAGLRVSDLYHEDVLRIYADLTNYGTVSGYEIRGYAAAARVFYGRSPAELTMAESFELASRVQNPRTRLPFRFARETESDYKRRLSAAQTRLSVALNNAVGQGQLERSTADEILTSVRSSLRPIEQIRADVRIPHRDLIVREILRRAPDTASRFIEVDVSANQAAQQILEDAESNARLMLEKQLNASEREDLAIDAVVLDADGNELAEIGQARNHGDGSSFYKPWLFQDALERGVLSSLEADVLPGMSARKALILSSNEAALKLIEKVGPAAFKARLEANGFSVVCSCPPIALGAGIDASPIQVAAAFRQFGFSDAGFSVSDTGFIPQIRDGKTGEMLFNRTRLAIADVRKAIAVRSALQDVSLNGTGKFLRPLAQVAPIASKTGTSAFFKDGRWQGNGGSWVVANDSRTGATVAARMRFSSNRPFRLEGGNSAVLVVKSFISNWRERSTR